MQQRQSSTATHPESFRDQAAQAHCMTQSLSKSVSEQTQGQKSTIAQHRSAKANAGEVPENADIASKKKRKLAEGKRASMTAHALA